MENAGDDTFYFIPIGNSKKDYREVQSKDSIQEVFKFNEQYTHIYGSLKRAEQSPYFNKVDKILIISDMEPDYQVSQAPWYFTRSEISSIKKTHLLLQRWSKTKKIHIVLQGWGNPPTREHYHIGEYETYDTLLQTQTKRIISKNNKKLAAFSLIALAEEKTVRLYATSRSASEAQNTEELHHIFCQNLPVKDKKMCTQPITPRQISNNFTLTIDIAKPIPLSRYFPDLRERIWDSQFIGPSRQFKITSLKKGISKTTPKTHFYFKVIPSDAGMSYSQPQILAHAQCTTEEHTVSEKRLSSPEQATRWIASVINSELKRMVTKCYPPAAPLKLIYVKDRQGRPLSGNYKFLVQYSYKGMQEQKKTAPTSIENGTLKLHIPH
ncbi:MAG: hypothetical protein KAH77_11960, partial [Thiomargarita sp.]|nr:hypothetical protein [Thiomargarita sp.]